MNLGIQGRRAIVCALFRPDGKDLEGMGRSLGEYALEPFAFERGEGGFATGRSEFGVVEDPPERRQHVRNR